MKGTKRIRNHKAKVYQTSHYLPEQIEKLKESANKQNKKIARWFWNNPDKLIGPTHLHKIFFPDFPDYRGKWPITSTRRAIKDLTDDHILLKTGETCKSLLGGIENKWRWKHPEDFKKEPEQGEIFSFSEPKLKSRAYSEASR